MKIKGVSVDPTVLSQAVTDHARKLGLIRPNEVLKLDFIEVNDPQLGVIFKKDKTIE